MRRKLILGAVAVVAFLVGAGIVASGKTRTVTRFKTVTDTNTVTSTKTVTVKAKSATPNACRVAITDARTVSVLAGGGFNIAAKWGPLVGRAATAGANQDVTELNAITAELKTDTVKLDALATRLRRVAADFNVNAARCR